MQFKGTMELLGQPFTALGDEDALIMKITADGSPVWTSQPSGHQRDIPLCIHRQHAPPYRLAFGGYFWGTITYGNSTISDMQNGDGMLVSGMDTTFHVNTHAVPGCGTPCNGTGTIFAQGAAPFTYQWSTGSTEPSLTGLCPGTYSVEVTDAHGALLAVTVTVPSLPDPGFSIQMEGDSLWVDGGVGWQWFHDGSTLLGENPWLTATTSGSYHALVADADGCFWSTDTVQVITTSVSLSFNADRPSIRPNPVHGTLFIDVPGMRPLAMELLNGTGQCLKRQTLVPGTDRMDLSGLPSGPYLLRSSHGGAWRVMVE
jgi:hypothetical protein